MDKPEDIRELVARAAYGAQWDEEFPKEGGIEWHMAMQVADAILPFIQSAQSQAYIDAARIAEEVRDDYQRRIESLPDNHYKTPYRLHSKHAADQVRAAILQRKEEIGR